MLTRLGLFGSGACATAQAPDAGSYTANITGCSISSLKALMSCAPSVPSTTRWSQVSVTVMIVAISILAERTTGRFRV